MKVMFHNHMDSHAASKFYHAFEAFLREKSENSSVRTKIQSDAKKRRVTIESCICLSKGWTKITWILVLSPNALVDGMCVETTGDEKEIDEFWQNAQLECLETLEKLIFWRRRLYRYMGVPMKFIVFVPGQWYCIPVLETMDGDLTTEKYVTLDIKISAPSKYHADQSGMHENVCAFVACFLDMGLSVRNEQVWTFSQGEAHSTPRRTGYIAPQLPLNIDHEPDIHDTSVSVHPLNDLVISMWEQLNSLSEKDKLKFYRACEAMRVSKILRDLNLRDASSAHMAIAVDALTEEGKKTSASFADFLVNYAGRKLTHEMQEEIHKLSKLYYNDVRSSYFHGGSTYLAEMDPLKWIERSSKKDRLVSELMLPCIIYRALVGWLDEKSGAVKDTCPDRDTTSND